MRKLACTFILLSALVGTSIMSVGCSPADSNQSAQNVAPSVETTDEDAINKQEDSNFKVVNAKAETAEEAIELLKQGNKRFLNDQSEQINISEERRTQLQEGQAPYAVVISCSDSRVSPSHVFNAGLGEIFEIRVAGNILDDMALGSVEYGAEHLGCPVIVVLGHECCGAVTATYEAITENQEVEGYISSIVEEIKPSIEQTQATADKLEKAECIEEAAHVNVNHVIKQIEADEAIAHLISEGKIKVVGAYYTLDGKVTFLDENVEVAE